MTTRYREFAWNSGSDRDRYFRERTAYASGRIDEPPTPPRSLSPQQVREIDREVSANTHAARKMGKTVRGRVEGMVRNGFLRPRPGGDGT